MIGVPPNFSFLHTLFVKMWYKLFIFSWRIVKSLFLLFPFPCSAQFHLLVLISSFIKYPKTKIFQATIALFPLPHFTSAVLAFFNHEGSIIQFQKISYGLIKCNLCDVIKVFHAILIVFLLWHLQINVANPCYLKSGIFVILNQVFEAMMWLKYFIWFD